MRKAFRGAALAAVAAVTAASAAAALAGCASIPSLNEPAVYSTFASVREDGSAAEVFVLHEDNGRANDDKYEYLVSRETDASGSSRFVLSMRYTGGAAEGIEWIAAAVDGRFLALGDEVVTRGYSGRYRSELVRAELGSDAAAAILAGSSMTLQYYGRYATFPVEIPGPGLDALKAFLKRRLPS